MATFGERIANFFGGTDTDTNEGLKGLFITEVKNTYYAEKVGMDGMTQSAEAATTDEVRDAFLQHRTESEQHVARLEQVMHSIGVSVEEGSCPVADGLAKNAQIVVNATESGSLTRDAGLIIAGQKGEHQEIASYGSLVTLAQVLGYSDAVRLLQQTLDEEKTTDHKLTQLAESFVNQRAASEGDDTNSTGGQSDVYDVTNPDGTRYADSGSTGQTYRSGQSYSGSQMGNTATTGTSNAPRSSSGNDATLGGTMGI